MNLKVCFIFVAFFALTTITTTTIITTTRTTGLEQQQGESEASKESITLLAGKGKFGAKCKSDSQCSTRLSCDMTTYKCVCTANYVYWEKKNQCIYCPAAKGWKLSNGKCVQLLGTRDGALFSWSSAYEKCKKLAGILLEFDDDLSPNEYIKLFEHDLKTTKFFIGARSLGRSLSNWTFPESGYAIESREPTWHCGNLEISAAVTLFANEDVQAKKCAFAENGQLKPAYCDDTERDEVAQFVCELPSRNKKNQKSQDIMLAREKKWTGAYCTYDGMCESEEFCNVKTYYCECSFGYHRHENSCRKCQKGYTYFKGECFKLFPNATSFNDASLTCMNDKAIPFAFDVEAITQYPKFFFEFMAKFGLDFPLWTSGASFTNEYAIFDRVNGSLNISDIGQYSWTRSATLECQKNLTASANSGTILSDMATRVSGMASVENESSGKCLSVVGNQVFHRECCSDARFVCQKPFDGFDKSALDAWTTKLGELTDCVTTVPTCPRIHDLSPLPVPPVLSLTMDTCMDPSEVAENSYVSFANDRLGNPSSSLYFNNGYVSLLPKNYFPNTAFTIGAWVKVKSFEGSPILYTFNDGKINNKRINEIYFEVRKRLIFRMSDQAGKIFIACPFRSELQLEKWQHVAATVYNKNVVLYLDGKLERGCKGNEVIQIMQRSNNFIGNLDPEGDSVLNAYVDSLKIFSYALSASQMAEEAKEIE